MLIITRKKLSKKTTLSYMIYRTYFSQECFRSVSRSAEIMPRVIGSVFLRRSLQEEPFNSSSSRFSMYTDLEHPRYYDSKRSFSISFPFSFFLAKKCLYWRSTGLDFFPEGTRGREGICFRSWQELWISRLVSRVLI